MTNSTVNKRIFFIGYSLDPTGGGIERYSFTILKYLKDKGYHIFVYTFDKNDGSEEHFIRIKLKRIKFFDRFLLGHRIANLLIKEKIFPDIIICSHLFLTPITEKICEKLNKKYVLMTYGIECWAGRFELFYKNLKNLDSIISISSFTSEQLIKQGYSGEIRYLPPVIDVEKFESCTYERNEESEIRFLTVGRLSASEGYKGHDKVIEAVSLLVHDYNIKHIKYRIVGKGDWMDFLKKLSKQLGVENYVEFLGYLSDEELIKVYKTSDVFIMPSRVSLNPKKPEGEGFGIVFLEAAACGLPLIGPNIGGPTDIISHMVNGLLCNPLSSEDIAEKMRYLIENESRRIEMGIRAKEIVKDKFSLQKLEDYIRGLF